VSEVEVVKLKNFVIVALMFFISFGSTVQTQPLPQGPTPSRPGLALNSAAFQDGGIIPNKYTRAAKGDPVSPRLMWTNVPTGTVTFAIVVRDPDTAISESLNEVIHWMIFNIPAGTRELVEGIPGEARLANGSVQAFNHNNKIGYMGMAAKSAGPYHRYTFELFALDTKLKLGPDATEAGLFREMDGHILMKGVLVGRFHLPRKIWL
jgi:Raf kinase inhibitor-like YbhB/YbcL family protein